MLGYARNEFPVANTYDVLRFGAGSCACCGFFIVNTSLGLYPRLLPSLYRRLALVLRSPIIFTGLLARMLPWSVVTITV